MLVATNSDEPSQNGTRPSSRTANPMQSARVKASRPYAVADGSPASGSACKPPCRNPRTSISVEKKIIPSPSSPGTRPGIVYGLMSCASSRSIRQDATRMMAPNSIQRSPPTTSSRGFAPVLSPCNEPVGAANGVCFIESSSGSFLRSEGAGVALSSVLTRSRFLNAERIR